MRHVPSIVVALLLAGQGAASLAADAASGLGSAFRPQLPPALPVANAGAQTTGDQPTSAAPPGLSVVLAGPGRTLATIDGKIVHVGDTFNGMRVVRIDLRGVVLAGEGGKKEEMAVNPSAIKRACPVGTPCVSQGVRP